MSSFLRINIHSLTERELDHLFHERIVKASEAELKHAMPLSFTHPQAQTMEAHLTFFNTIRGLLVANFPDDYYDDDLHASAIAHPEGSRDVHVPTAAFGPAFWSQCLPSATYNNNNNNEQTQRADDSDSADEDYDDDNDCDDDDDEDEEDAACIHKSQEDDIVMKQDEPKQKRIKNV